MAMVSPKDLQDSKPMPQLEGPGRANHVGLIPAGYDVASDAAPSMIQTRRREQLRMLEDQLLAKSTLAELKAAAEQEAKGASDAQ
jgi:hypothetical protein